MATVRDRTTALNLTTREARDIAGLALETARRYKEAEDPGLLRQLPLVAAALPPRVRRFLRAFTLDELPGYCAITGHAIDDSRVGPTPGHWKDESRPHGEHPEEILLLLYAALLGEPFGWGTHQNGHLVNDVFPIREYQDQLLGTGSAKALTLHTEDAFHPYRADYIILASLRNPQRVPIIVAEPDFAALSAADRDVLFGERFSLIPDTSHLPRNNTVHTDEDRHRFERIQRLFTEPRPAAILLGSPDDPLLRFDATHMAPLDGDEPGARAFGALHGVLKDGMTACPLATGDFVFLNNHRVVHGRQPFAARYDGTDRWLKRVNVTHDLRKSRDLRRSAASRLIG